MEKIQSYKSLKKTWKIIMATTLVMAGLFGFVKINDVVASSTPITLPGGTSSQGTYDAYTVGADSAAAVGKAGYVQNPREKFTLNNPKGAYYSDTSSVDQFWGFKEMNNGKFVGTYTRENADSFLILNDNGSVYGMVNGFYPIREASRLSLLESNGINQFSYVTNRAEKMIFKLDASGMYVSGQNGVTALTGPTRPFGNIGIQYYDGHVMGSIWGDGGPIFNANSKQEYFYYGEISGNTFVNEKKIPYGFVTPANHNVKSGTTRTLNNNNILGFGKSGNVNFVPENYVDFSLVLVNSNANLIKAIRKNTKGFSYLSEDISGNPVVYDREAKELLVINKNTGEWY